jgi:mRNA interferase MazF
MTASVDELWLTDFGQPFPGEPAHHRPALVLGPPDLFGADFPFVIVCPLTSRWRGLSLHVEVEASAATGLDDVSYVQCELLRSISRRRLIHRLGRVSLEVRRAVDEVVRTLLDH